MPFNGVHLVQVYYDCSINYPFLGLLASGDCDANIHFYKLADENGSEWVIDNVPYKIHAGSVEDIQFSPNQENVCASCITRRL
jgi:hypothetical protein